MKNTQNKKYTLALTMIFSLFFIWAISASLLPTMIRQLMKTCDLTTFEASFTETAYWLAYFIFPIPIAMFMKRFSYKAGIIFGLMIAALGGLLFFPAAEIKEYWAYLTIFFIIATGMCFLETAANPYVTVLGDPNSSSRRLNLAQSFNGLGAFISAMFLSKLVLSGKDYVREAIPGDPREVIPVDYPGGWEGFIQFETNSMKLPYLILAGVLILLAIIFIFTHLPKIKEGERVEGDTKGDKLIDFGVLKRSHLRKGVIAQFFYNGGQTAIFSLFLVYTCKYMSMPESNATTYYGLFMLAFLLGRWIGTFLMKRFKPQDMLVFYALAAAILCGIVMIYGDIIGVYAFMGIGFFMSIMYPTQFSLALKDLGKNTKSGSAFLVMAIVANACIPQLTAYIMHHNEHIYQIAYIIPLICFIYCAYYGWKGHKVID